MAWNKMILDETTIQKRLKEGRGKGEGVEYKPWLTVRDVPSHGWSSRIMGWKTNRLHHALSSHEADYVYIGEWSKKIVDIREQYPLLPLENTLAIAESCGIKHPIHPKTKKPIVLTTDFCSHWSTKGDVLSKRGLSSLLLNYRQIGRLRNLKSSDCIGKRSIPTGVSLLNMRSPRCSPIMSNAYMTCTVEKTWGSLLMIFAT